MSDPYVKVVLTAADLKRQVPERYAEFSDAVRYLADRANAEFLAAERKQLLFAQGRAVALIELANKIGNCIELEKKLRERT